MFRRNDTNSTQSLPENRKGTLSDLFYEASITLLSKLYKYSIRKLENMPHEHRYKNP